MKVWPLRLVVVKIPICLRVGVRRASRPGQLYPPRSLVGSRYVSEGFERLALGSLRDLLVLRVRVWCLRLRSVGVQAWSDSSSDPSDWLGLEGVESVSGSAQETGSLGLHSVCVWGSWMDGLGFSVRMISIPGAKVRMWGSRDTCRLPCWSMVIVVLGFGPRRIFDRGPDLCGSDVSSIMCL